MLLQLFLLLPRFELLFVVFAPLALRSILPVYCFVCFFYCFVCCFHSYILRAASALQRLAWASGFNSNFIVFWRCDGADDGTIAFVSGLCDDDDADDGDTCMCVHQH